MRKLKCSTMLGVILLLVVVIVNSCIGIYYTQKVVGLYRLITTKQLSALAVSRSNTIESFFDTQMSVVENIANSDLLKEYLTNVSNGTGDTNNKYIDDIIQLCIKQENLKYNENVYIIDEAGKIVLSNIKSNIGTVPQIDLSNYIRDKEKTGVSRIVEDGSINMGQKCVMIYSPIVLDNGARYCYYKTIDEDFLTNHIADLSLFEKGFICMIDDTNASLNGVSFDSAQSLDILCRGISTYLDNEDDSLVKDIREEGTFTYLNTQASHTAFYSSVMNANMVYVVSIPTDTLNEVERGLITRFNQMMIIVSVLCMLLIYIAIHILLVKPLSEINMTINRLLKNNKYERVIQADTSYEMSQFSIGINQLVAKFRAEIEELSSFRERYRVISENSKDITFEWNLQTGYLYYSSEWDRRFAGAYPKTSLLDAFLDLDSVHPNDLEVVEKTIHVMKMGNDTQSEFRIQDSSREYKWLLTRTTTIKSATGEPEKVVGIMIDINKLKASQMEFMNKAMYDRLTGLYNMESFEFKIADELDMCKMSGVEMGVMFIDIDDFKHFNDEYGHEVGNEVLIYVANTLSELAMPNSGFAARFGGDEFLMCIKGVNVEEKIVALAKEFLESVHELDSKLLNKTLSISCSVGISLYPRDASTAKELVKKSDAAMYKIKRDGKDGVVLFEEEMMN